MNRRPDLPEDRHYDEPEIIPPSRPGREKASRGAWTRVDIFERGTQRVYIGKIGPLGMLAFWLVAGLVSIALLIFFLGAFVFFLPLAAVLVGLGIVASLFRAFSRRL